jgi:hypothetical protein
MAGNLGIVVADAPGTCVQYYEEAVRRMLSVANGRGQIPKLVTCAINRAGLKLLEAKHDFGYWSSWHYAKLLEWAQRVDFHGKLITNNNVNDGRFFVHPVRYQGGSSVFPAAQILQRYYNCPRVVVVNVEFSNNYKHFIIPWKEAAQHLKWCRAYTGPLKKLLGVPTADWLLSEFPIP